MTSSVAFALVVCIRQQTGIHPTLWAQGLRDQIQKRALQTENPSCIGFAVLGGGLRPWSQTMASEGARPWGRGRSEFAKSVLSALAQASRQNIP